MSANISLPRGRGLHGPASSISKPPPLSQHQLPPSTVPSNVSLFLTNLRLLDFDQRDDWPGITTVTFSTKDAQQNQKKRIQCVEWALFQLFVLWDPDETRDKLQPFFPPLEHLQSLNLRSALFRCLDQIKKSGVLGRDAVLRKTMLDECKGERLEEVLAVFSTAVLQRVVQERNAGHHHAVSQGLAMENISYTGDRTMLSMLILAHKSSLNSGLITKKESRARYNDFSELLNLKERQIIRRHEQVKVSAEDEQTVKISDNEADILRDRVEKNWTGSSEWLESILHGDSWTQNDGILSGEFNNIWKHVEDGRIGDIECQEQRGLLEQLDSRVRHQNHRLAKWQSFEKTITQERNGNSAKEKSPEITKRTKGIDLGFTEHDTLQVVRSPLKSTSRKKLAVSSQYAQLIDSMKTELSKVGTSKQREMTFSRQAKLTREEMEASPTEPNLLSASPTLVAGNFSQSSPISESPVPKSNNYQIGTSSQTPPSEHVSDGDENLTPDMSPSYRRGDKKVHSRQAIDISSTRQISTYSDMPPPSPPLRTPSPLAAEILASVLTTSPSPIKPRHVLSLAERTRLSMSLASTAKSSFPQEDSDDGLGDLPSYSPPQKSRRGLKSTNGQGSSDEGTSVKSSNQHEDLIARTRQSMSNFANVQKSAQVDRRRSIKAAARNKRESRSSYFPKALDTAMEDDGIVPSLDSLDKKKLIEGEVEVDYDIVFKSRPRIKTSPERSPDRSPVKAWGDMGGRGDVNGNSSPLSGDY